MVRETRLGKNDLILPLFARSGKRERRPVPSMPGVEQLSADLLVEEAALAAQWLGAEYAVVSHYLEAAGNPDVEKFVSLLNNMHSDDAPSIKPIVLEASEAFVYPPELA